ncbi:MAG: BamA/TamA family outer membrane protein [Fidelibacterota bacterium]
MIAGFLEAQESTVVVDIETNGDRSDLAAALASVREAYGESGQLGTVLSCVAVEALPGKEGTLRTRWTVSPSSPFTVDSVVVLADDPSVARAAGRLLAPLKNGVASRASLTRASGILNAYALLPAGEVPGYAVYGNQRVALVVPIKKTGNNTVMGTAGWQPRSGGNGGVTGEIKLHLERLFGTVSRSDIWWYRTNAFSQFLSVNYEELYVWKFNFGGRIGFQHDFRDGLYVARRTELALVAPWSRWGRWYIGGERTRVTATAAGRLEGMDNHRVRSLVLGNERDTRDSSWNPSRGTFVEGRASAGAYSVSGHPSDVLVRLRVNTEVVAPFSRRWSFSLGVHGGYVRTLVGGAVPPSELFRYGGASSLRGYREERFSSTKMAIVQLEWRYRLRGPNRFALFVDGALSDGSQPPPVAFGGGIQQKTPLGVLRLEYAVSREDLLSGGKIHLRLLGEF